MEERKINLKKNDDKTPVLDPDGILYEKLKAMQDGMNDKFSLMLSLLKEGKLTESTKEKSLELFHRNAVAILNELGYEDSLNKKYNISNEDARKQLKLICESFKEWWNNEGTGYVDSITFNQYGMDASLKGLINPSWDKRKIEEQVSMLKEKGFDVSPIINFGYHLTDTEKNCEMLKELFINTFSKYIHVRNMSVATYLGGEKGEELVDVIYSINVTIHKLDDIKITEP